MPRSQSNTVKYFPHFAEQGKTLFILKSRFGNDGYAFWFQLLELLCRQENHFYDFSTDTAWQYLLARTGVDAITGTEILQLLASLGKIDTEMWGRKIIWCDKLVNNVELAYKKRGRSVPERPVSVPETAVSVSTTPDPVSGIPHIKLNYIKEDNPLISPLTDKPSEKKPTKTHYGEFKNVLLTNDEYTHLHDRFNQETMAKIEQLSSYIASTGKRYKSHYATILNWAERDRKESKHGKSQHSRELPKVYTPTPDYPDL